MTAPVESSFAGAGGVEIFRRAWLPDGEPTAVVAIAHGAGEHSGRYGHVAGRLTRDGYAVYAIDHRGHGRSQGPRALVDRMDNTVADLDKLIVFAGGGHPAYRCSCSATAWAARSRCRTRSRIRTGCRV